MFTTINLAIEKVKVLQHDASHKDWCNIHAEDITVLHTLILHRDRITRVSPR